MTFRRSLAVTLGAALLTATVVTEAGAVEQPLTYVALGDSYSAGSGNLPFSPDANPFCARSVHNFSHVIAATTGAAMTDVSCGGAQTKDFTKPQYPGLAPQLDAVSADADLVTMTIGGNDAGTLALAAGGCAAAALLTLGTGSPCTTLFGSTFVDRVQNIVYPNVRAALQAVRAKAPSAQVVVVGYPWIMPATRGCYPRLPIASGDIPFMRTLQARLNGVIQQAATETGAIFVDMAARSDGHDSCQAPGTRWIEPILGARSFALIHPNQAGEAAMARAVLDQFELG